MLTFFPTKLADLGLSRSNAEDNAETLNKVRGTYQYSAPETYQSKVKYTAKSDVYSIAIIFWELAMRGITGEYQVPFKEYNLPMPFQILIKVAKEDLRPTISPKCPEPFKELITTVWDKNPTKRPSISKLIEILRNMIVTEYFPNKYEWDSALSCGPKDSAHYEKYKLLVSAYNEQESKRNQSNVSPKHLTGLDTTTNSGWHNQSIRDLKNMNSKLNENENN